MSTPNKNLAFTSGTTSLPRFIIYNLHECKDQIVHYCFVQTNHFDFELLEPLVVHRLRKVTCWQFYIFIYSHIEQSLHFDRLYISWILKLENISKSTVVMHLQESYDHLIAHNKIVKSQTTQRA
jgi:hypothetical protein